MPDNQGEPSGADLLNQNAPGPKDPSLPVEPAEPGDTGPWWKGMRDDAVKEFLGKSDEYKTPEGLAHAHYRMVKKYEDRPGAIHVPGKGASAEEVERFYRALGRPDTADQYVLEVPDALVDGDQLATQGRNLFLESGLTKQQAEQVWNGFVRLNSEFAEKTRADWQRQGAEGLELLKKEHGDKFDEFVARGRRAVAALSLEKEALDAIEVAVGTNAFLRLFGEIGSKLREGEYLSGQVLEKRISPDQMSLAQLKETIHEFYADPTWGPAYRDGAHPQHDMAVKKFTQMMTGA